MEKVVQRTEQETELEKTIFEGIDEKTKVEIEAMVGKTRLALGLVARLRGPKGCPWDREQNHLTLRPYLIEEAYEVLDVLDRYQSGQDPKQLAKQTPHESWVPADGKFSPADSKLLREELGDLLLQVVLHSQLAAERGEFDFGAVAENLAAKLVGRHPHVFAEKNEGINSEKVLQNWESLKKKEGKKSVLDGLPRGLPSLQRAARMGDKVARMGFDWENWTGAWDKVLEETAELKEAVDSKNPLEIESEFGDLVFSLCNLARFLNLQPEDAHRKAVDRFEARFRRLEEICGEEGIDIQTAGLAKLDKIWDRVKVEFAQKKNAPQDPA